MRLRFEHAYLARILKTLLPHVGVDRGRPHLCGLFIRVDVEGVPVLTSTNAIALAVWRATEASVVEPNSKSFFMDARDVQPILDAIDGVWEPSGVEIDTDTGVVLVDHISITLSAAGGWEPPPFVAVLSKLRRDTLRACGWNCFDARLLKECFASVDTACGEGSASVDIFTTSPPDVDPPVDPVVLVPTHVPDLMIVAMPLRAEEPAKRWPLPTFAES